MTLADKLQTIAQNQQLVYQAGQKSMIDESKIIEEISTGTNYLLIDDVSEIAHECNIQLYPTSLLDNKVMYENSNKRYVSLQGDLWTVNFVSGALFVNNQVKTFYPAGTYTISLYSNNGVNCNFYAYRYENATNESRILFYNFKAEGNGIQSYTFTTTEPFIAALGGAGNEYLGTYTFRMSMYQDQYVYPEAITVSSPNLIPYPYFETESSTVINGVTFTVNADGSVTANGTATGADATFRVVENWSEFVIPAGEYTLTGSPVGGSGSTYYIEYCLKDADGNVLNNQLAHAAGKMFYIDKPSATMYFQLKVKSGQTVNNIVFKPMIINGYRNISFSKHIASKTYTTDSIGKDIKISSISPNMVVTTSSESSISVSYNKSYGYDNAEEHFWNQLQNYGSRTAYNGAFAYWSTPRIEPKYDIKTSTLYELFATNAELVELPTDRIKYTPSAGASCYSMARSCRNLTRIDLDLSVGTTSGVNTTGYLNTFYQCSALTYIKKITVREELTFGNTFLECYALTDVTFDGVIGQDLNMQWSPLSIKSIKSILSCLKPGAGKTLTLNSDAWTALENSGEIPPQEATWADYVTVALGWNLVV